MSGVDLVSIFPPQAFLSYLGALFLIGVVAMAVDKGSAKMGFDRISERDLALIAFAGGFSGIILGGITIHHKTSKPDFWVPVAVATLIWGTILVAYFYPGILRF